MDSSRGVATFAVPAPTSDQPTAVSTVPIAILGTDAVLAAAPATPVQLAHACLRAGFANVIPASWGDELIAAAVLRRLPQFGSGPAIQCSCPIVAHRLLTASGDLRPVLLPLVPPPVAVARYVRSLVRPHRARITYIGSCPGANDESIDIRMSPDALISMLAEREIVVADQPEMFESIIPPDRRRFRSQPGGAPTAEALWTEFGARTLVELDGEDFVGDVAQQLLSGKNVLIDASTRLGCVCSGAGTGARNPRANVIAHEPPRATAPVVEERTPIDLDLEIPAVTRTPVDVVALSAAANTTRNVTPPASVDTTPASRTPASRSTGPHGEVRLPRLSTPVVPRTVLSGFPQTRDLDGKALPRAYVARRRPSPRHTPIVPSPDELPGLAPPPATESARREMSPPALEQPNLAESAPVANPAVQEPAPPVATAPIVPPQPAPAPVLPLDAGSASCETDAPAPVFAREESVQTISDPVFAEPPRPAAPRTPARSARPIPPSMSAVPPRNQAPTSFSRGQVALIIIAVAAIAICASTVVAVIVSKSVTAASVNAASAR